MLLTVSVAAEASPTMDTMASASTSAIIFVTDLPVFSGKYEIPARVSSPEKPNLQRVQRFPDAKSRAITQVVALVLALISHVVRKQRLSRLNPLPDAGTNHYPGNSIHRSSGKW